MAYRTRFLIDENLSPELAKVGGGDAEIWHVNQRGLASTPDHLITRWCVAHDFALVTNNGRDFLRLFAQLEVHSGLVIVAPTTIAARQIALFQAALTAIGEELDLVNKLVEVQEDGLIVIRDWPQPI